MFKIRNALLVLLLLPSLSFAGSISSMLRDDSLYSSASSTSTKKLLIKKSSSIEVLGKSGGWINVKYAGQIGWVRLLSVKSVPASSNSDLSGVLALKNREPSKVVAVAGLRGINSEELKSAEVSYLELDRLEKLRAIKGEAVYAAKLKNLKSDLTIDFLEEPVPVSNVDNKQYEGSSDSLWGF